MDAKEMHTECAYSREVLAIKDILPSLDEAVIERILRANENDLEKALDAALAHQSTLDSDLDSSSLAAITLKGMEACQMPLVSRLTETALSIAQNANGTQSKVTRGIAVALPRDFLAIPEYRVVRTAQSPRSQHYTVYFRKDDKKLGITIFQFNYEVVIYTVAATERKGGEDTLAKRAQVKVGDALQGINDDFFTPTAEIYDCLELLNLSGNYVRLHFVRELPSADDPRSSLHLDEEPHRAISPFLEQGIISPEQVKYVNKLLLRLKQRVLKWNDVLIHRRIEEWGLFDTIDFRLFDPSTKEGSNSRISGGGYLRGWSSRTKKQQQIERRNTTSGPGSPGWKGDISSSGLADNGSSSSFNHKAENLRSRRGMGTSGSVIAASSSSKSMECVVSAARRTVSPNDSDSVIRRLILEEEHHSRLKSEQQCRHSGSSRDSSNAEIDTDENIDSEALNEIRQLARLKRLRPAVAFQLIGIEEQSSVIYFVIWARDVKTGLEWTVKRRFSEFSDFREALVKIRVTLESVEFPRKRMKAKESAVLVDERMRLLRRFLRKVSSMLCINTAHPSTIKLQLIVQRFLQMEERQDAISRAEQERNRRLPVGIVQVFVHSLLQMAIMDKVIYGFTDAFLERYYNPEYLFSAGTGGVPPPSSGSSGKTKVYSIEESTKILEDVKQFIDHLQNFLVNSFYEDCREILLAFYEKNEELTPRFVHNGQAFKSPVSVLHKAKSKQDQEEESGLETLLESLTEDELRANIVSAVRKAIEIEVYSLCQLTLSSILYGAYAKMEKDTQALICTLNAQPQSYFGIPLQMISPSSWENIIYFLEHIRDAYLPSDRIETVVEFSKCIPSLFQIEHPEAEKPLGADDLLPIFIYIVVRARVPLLLALNAEMQLLCDPHKRLSEAGYYLATLEASLQHIIENDVNINVEKIAELNDYDNNFQSPPFVQFGVNSPTLDILSPRQLSVGSQRESCSDIKTVSQSLNLLLNPELGKNAREQRERSLLFETSMPSQYDLNRLSGCGTQGSVNLRPNAMGLVASDDGTIRYVAQSLGAEGLAFNAPENLTAEQSKIIHYALNQQKRRQMKEHTISDGRNGTSFGSSQSDEELMGKSGPEKTLIHPLLTLDDFDDEDE